MNVALILAGMAGMAYFLWKQNKSSSTVVDGTTLPGQFQFSPPSAIKKPTSTVMAERAGQALTAATGIPGFSEVGGKIANLFGAGRRQANDLVQNYQNPLGDYLAQIVAAWNDALQRGVATNNLREQVKAMMRTAATQVYAK